MVVDIIVFIQSKPWMIMFLLWPTYIWTLNDIDIPIVTYLLEETICPVYFFILVEVFLEHC